jgi:hypothetical protein
MLALKRFLNFTSGRATSFRRPHPSLLQAKPYRKPILPPLFPANRHCWIPPSLVHSASKTSCHLVHMGYRVRASLFNDPRTALLGMKMKKFVILITNFVTVYKALVTDAVFLTLARLGQSACGPISKMILPELAPLLTLYRDGSLHRTLPFSVVRRSYDLTTSPGRRPSPTLTMIGNFFCG